MAKSHIYKKNGDGTLQDLGITLTQEDVDKIDSINNLDTELSTTSENAVQNKVITEAINNTQTNLSNVVNNTTKIANSNGGFSAGTNSSAATGGALGSGAKETYGGGAIGINTSASKGFAGGRGTTAVDGGAVGWGATAEIGGAVGSGATVTGGGGVGNGATTGNGFAGGYLAKTMTDTSDNSTVIDAIQLGQGTNATAKTLQIYGDNIYNADTHTLNVQKIDTTNTKIGNSKGGALYGGFSAGYSLRGLSSATSGGAIGSYARATEGGAVGSGAYTTEGGAVGSGSISSYGGAIGEGARTSDGAAIGWMAESGNGAAIGHDAKTLDSDGNPIDAIQLGTGKNTQEKTLQIYGDNIYNANTHTLNVQNIKKNGVVVPDINGYISALNQADTRYENYPPSYYRGLHNNGKNVVVEFKDNSKIGLTSSMLVPSYSPYSQVETHVSWGDQSGGQVVQIAYTYAQIFIRDGDGETWNSWKEVTSEYVYDSPESSSSSYIQIGDMLICYGRVGAYEYGGAAATKKYAINFPKEFSDNKYFIMAMNDINTSDFNAYNSTGRIGTENKTSTGCTIIIQYTGSYYRGVDYIAIGKKKV